jgi:hypothetical protein
MTFESHYRSSINIPASLKALVASLLTLLRKAMFGRQRKSHASLERDGFPHTLACVLHMLVKSLLPINFMSPYYFSFDFDILSFNCVTSTKFYFILIN